MAQEQKIIIGLVSPIAGGKGTAVDFLKKHGFWATSLSDRIREEIRKNGDKVTRKNMLRVADQMRQEFGPAVLAQKTWQQVTEKEKRKVVIDSIRGEAEVDFLKKQANFYLLGINAPRRQRFERAKERGREGEPMSWEEFLAVDKKDFKSGQGQVGRNIAACLQKADQVIENNSTIETFEEKLSKFLKQIEQNG